jgi:hypothetical protein
METSRKDSKTRRIKKRGLNVQIDFEPLGFGGRSVRIMIESRQMEDYDAMGYNRIA